MEKENKRSCPACGSRVPASAETCPTCGLTGLNSHFLSRAGYEKWVRQVLEPHKASMTPKVFAGNRYGLILTVRGELYGIGRNENHQISDADQPRYDQPVLMAEDVISAAAGSNVTGYVTRDGRLHWQCDRKAVDWLPEVSDVRAVYVEDWHWRFWMVKNSGEVLCIGKNHDELLEDSRRMPAYEFPEVTGVIYNFSHQIHWSDSGTTSRTAEEYFRKSKEYLRLIQQHGADNVELEVNETEPNKALKTVHSAFRVDQKEYRSRLYVLNRFLYEPTPFRKKWREDLPHRFYSRPLLAGEYVGKIARAPGVKKVCGPGGTAIWLALQEDGSVESSIDGPLDWLKVPVRDLAWGLGMILLVCANGEILWYDGAMFEENEWDKMKEGRLNTCRLPNGA